MSVLTPPELVGTSTGDALLERLFNAVLGTMDLFLMSIGDRLGFYQAIVESGSVNSIELAKATGTAERYCREWLEQQTVTGFLLVDEVEAEAKIRRYQLPEAYEEILTNPTSLSYGAPLARIASGSVAPFEKLVDAYRSGEGISFDQYGIDMLEGQASMNRPHFENLLASEWLAAMPDIYDRLSRGDSVKIADIGMGCGWSSISIAKAFPNTIVHGFDLDEASVLRARANAVECGVQDQVRFDVQDVSDPSLAGQYDLATAFECIHDMSNPVAALGSMRRLVGDGGTVMVMDERVEDAFTVPGGDVERLMYGFSCLHCLPVGLVDKPSAATGTVMRSGTFTSYAESAGFRSVEILPVEHDFWKFYRLTA